MDFIIDKFFFSTSPGSDHFSSFLYAERLFCPENSTDDDVPTNIPAYYLPVWLSTAV